MRDVDLVYLAHLVKRDGDRDLQGFFMIEPAKLYSELMALADQTKKRKSRDGKNLVVPIMSRIEIEPTQHGLDYEPMPLKPHY